VLTNASLTALLAVSLQVLILLDRTYLGRFWTQFEAWLSMQCASVDGLVSAEEGSRRCIIECVHEAPERLKGALIEEWSQVTAETAHRKLSASDVSVTNASDKEGQLPKLFILDRKVCEIAKLLGLERRRTRSSSQTAEGVPETSSPEASSDMRPVAHQNAVLQAENRKLKQQLEVMEREIFRLQEENAELRRSPSSPSILEFITGSLSQRASASALILSPDVQRSVSAQI
jgi:hypothetical protein